MEPKVKKTTKGEGVAVRLIKATTRLIFPKKTNALTRLHWAAQMMTTFKGLSLSEEQWVEIYNQQAIFFQAGIKKGFSIPFYGMGAILPTRVETKNLEVETEEGIVLGKNIAPILYTNDQLAALN